MTNNNAPVNLSAVDKYRPAMQIRDQAEADAYFEFLVEHNMAWSNVGKVHTRAEAEAIERQNLGYFAGYFDDTTRERVERLFRCKRPLLGTVAGGAAIA